MNIEHIRVEGLVGRGPNGATPSDGTSVEPTDEQIESLQEADYTVSIVFHHLKETWTDLQRRGLKQQFDILGITIEGVYGSKFNADTQSQILRQLSRSDVDAVVSIPVDIVETAEAYRAVADAGIDLVFMDNVPRGFKHGRDYAGCVSSDNKGAGIVAGRFLREFVTAGTVGMITFTPPFYVTEQRETGVREVIDESDELELVIEEGFTDPNHVSKQATTVLKQWPDLDGLYVSWCDPPAVQVTDTVESAGRENLIITTTDLSLQTVDIIARDGPIKATGAQFPFQQGIIEANMIGQALLGNDTPPYIASGSLPVCKDNLPEQYSKYYQEDFPVALRE
jgi:ribose transport system substrate-binding protein